MTANIKITCESEENQLINFITVDLVGAKTFYKNDLKFCSNGSKQFIFESLNYLLIKVLRRGNSPFSINIYQNAVNNKNQFTWIIIVILTL